MSAAVRMHCDEGLNKKGDILVRNLMLLLYPAAVSHTWGTVEKKKKRGCMGEDVGVFVWERGKTDHVTSLIHPPGLYVCSGTKEWPLRMSFYSHRHRRAARRGEIVPGCQCSDLIFCVTVLDLPEGACYRVVLVLGEDLKLVRCFFVVVVIVFINLILPCACMRDSLTPATRLHK